MGLFKFLPKQAKDFLRRKVRAPTNIYGNMHTYKKLDEYHTGKFNYFHNKFCLNDLHLKLNTELTRFRNYNNLKFAEYSIRQNTIGSFLSVGISYGTSVKVITHLLDEKVENIEYFLIDDYKNVGGVNYNTDIDNVKKDLKDIKNFKFSFVEELLCNSSLSKVNNSLIFSHLNTGSFEAEFEFLPQIIKKTKINGVIIVDNYGFWGPKEINIFDSYVLKNKNIFKMVLPSMQCVLIKL